MHQLFTYKLCAYCGTKIRWCIYTYLLIGIYTLWVNADWQKCVPPMDLELWQRCVYISGECSEKFLVVITWTLALLTPWHLFLVHSFIRTGGKTQPAYVEFVTDFRDLVTEI